MKPLFNDYSMQRLNRVALPLVVAMSISTACLPLLTPVSVENPRIETVAFYDLYRLGSLFSLAEENNGTSMKKVMKEVLTPVPHTLNAVYSDGSRAFVAINDGQSTTFVDYGDVYKNTYRLVSISPTSAVFSAYGTRMHLRLGEPGNLTIKEKVASYVPDASTAAASNYVIPRSMVDRYTQNMGETWKNIAMQEVVDQGKIIGFKVSKITEGTPFALLGLQKGDIITGIDNKPLTSYATAFSSYQNGLRRSAIKITVLRNNQPKDLEYEISR